MIVMRPCLPVLALILPVIAGACATRPEPVAVAAVAPPPVVPTVVAAMPAGASPNMRIPAMLPTGEFMTPNRDLSPEGALWHLRGGLNVAALACRGPNEAATVARYNALLGSRKAVLASTQTRYQAEFKGVAAKDWQVRWDDAMTRLYNYFSLSPARTGFCAAAESLLAEAETVPDAQLATWAATRLPELDRPFTDFYRAYAAWQAQSAPVPVATPPVVYASTSGPRVEVDASVFRIP